MSFNLRWENTKYTYNNIEKGKDRGTEFLSLWESAPEIYLGKEKKNRTGDEWVQDLKRWNKNWRNGKQSLSWWAKLRLLLLFPLE